MWHTTLKHEYIWLLHKLNYMWHIFRDHAKRFKFQYFWLKQFYWYIISMYVMFRVLIEHDMFRTFCFWWLTRWQYFAGNFDKYFKFAFESSTSDINVFRADALRAVCAMDESLIQPFRSITCPSPSVATFVALMENTSCEALTDGDVSHALAVLQQCVPYYYGGALREDCAEGGCPGVPQNCSIYAFIIIHYLTDYEFLNPQTGNRGLRYIHLGADVPKALWKDFYVERLHRGDMDNGVIKVAGMDARPKFEIFNVVVKEQMLYFVLAGAVIFLVMCVYLKSIAITAATLLEVNFSIVTAYFLFFFVFRFAYFPFINIFSMLIVLAIGADDVFIFYDTYKIMTKLYPDKDQEFRLAKTMDHAALSIFVTSFTTAAAFLANLVSEITNLQLFGVFSCTTILCNFLLVITWIPACIVLIERFDEKCIGNKSCCACWEKMYSYLQKLSEFVFTKAFPFLILKLWYIWLIVFLALGTFGFVATLYSPKLKLPSVHNLQTFLSSHPFARYTLDIQYQFRYVQTRTVNALDVGFIIGVEPQDNGDHHDPHDYGHLVFEEGFDLTSPPAWMWLKDFCMEVKNSSFAVPEVSDTPCLMGLFGESLAGPCVGNASAPCCGTNGPYPDDIFSLCFNNFMLQLGDAANQTLDRVYFNENNNIVAYRADVSTNLALTGSHVDMKSHYNLLDNFVKEQSSTAPTGITEVWFNSIFRFYDLQRALSESTFIAVIVSLSCAAVMMLLTSRNFLVTLYAIVTITLAIFFSTGILVNLGWQLNIMEAVILTASVGLSIDFTIHYGVAYRLAESPRREDRVTYALTYVGSSVFMAAATTFLAGASVVYSYLMGYQQLAIFLMLVMASSWSFATFFFLSLCRIIGPEGQCAQIPVLCPCCTSSSEATDSGYKQAPAPTTLDLKELQDVEERQTSPGRCANGHTPQDTNNSNNTSPVDTGTGEGPVTKHPSEDSDVWLPQPKYEPTFTPESDKKLWTHGRRHVDGSA